MEGPGEDRLAKRVHDVITKVLSLTHLELQDQGFGHVEALRRAIGNGRLLTVKN